MGCVAFAPQDPGAPSPLQMQVLVYLASHDVVTPKAEPTRMGWLSLCGLINR
jgi:hypothetical protein